MIITLLLSSVIVFDIVNPESFIAKENRQQAALKGRSLDFSYIGSSSPDAAEALVQLYQSADATKQNEMRWKLCQMLKKADNSDHWQEWNYSLFRAKEALFPIKYQLECNNTGRSFF